MREKALRQFLSENRWSEHNDYFINAFRVLVRDCLDLRKLQSTNRLAHTPIRTSSHKILLKHVAFAHFDHLRFAL